MSAGEYSTVAEMTTRLESILHRALRGIKAVDQYQWPCCVSAFCGLEGNRWPRHRRETSFFASELLYEGNDILLLPNTSMACYGRREKE